MNIFDNLKKLFDVNTNVNTATGGSFINNGVINNISKSNNPQLTNEEKILLNLFNEYNEIYIKGMNDGIHLFSKSNNCDITPDELKNSDSIKESIDNLVNLSLLQQESLYFNGSGQYLCYRKI